LELFSDARSDSFQDFIMELAPNYASGIAPPLHLFVAFPEIDLSNLPNVAVSAGVAADVKRLDGELCDLVVRLRKRRASAKLRVSDSNWMIMVSSPESPVTSGEVFEKWLDSMHPKLVSAFFDSRQVLDLVDSFGNLEMPPEISVSEFVLREYPKGPTHKTWEKGKPYDRSIIEKQIKENNAALDSIKFRIFADRDSFECRVSRNGHMVFYEGSISQFMSLVVSPMAEIAKVNYDFFRDRERDFVQGEIVLNEIRLKTEKDIPTRHLERLGDAICNAFVGAVLHSGNPMLYVNAIDRLDGSMFDICAYPDEITIIPYSKATPSSLISLYMLITEVAPLTRRMEGTLAQN